MLESLMTFPVPLISLQLETVAFRSGWEFSPHPVKFPFLGRMQQSGGFSEEGHKEQS